MEVDDSVSLARLVKFELHGDISGSFALLIVKTASRSYQAVK